MAANDAEPTIYRVEISDVAQAEINASYLYLSSHSPEIAYKWH